MKTLSQPIQLSSAKICGTCGKVFDHIPVGARPWVEMKAIIGYVWECECGSTLFKASPEVMRSYLRGLQEK